MGQQVVTLMYGISNKTKGMLTEDGDYAWDAPSAPREKRLDWQDARYPRSAYEGGVIGFAVASGPGQDDKEGYLGETTTLTGLEKTHAKHIKEAKRRWKAFAAWMLEEHKKRLPKPALWLTTDERA